MSLVFEARDDYDVLRHSKSLNTLLRTKDRFFSIVHSDVVRVGEGFYITSDLKITVASLRKLREKGIPLEPGLLKDIYYSALAHENAHALLFPFMTRINIVYSILYWYCRQKGIEFKHSVFNELENIVSDIFNELIIYTHGLEGAGSLPALRYYYVYLSSASVADRERLETNPVKAVFHVHNKVFASILHNKLSTPKVPNPKYISEHVYNLLYTLASLFNIEAHVKLVVMGGFSNVVSALVNQGFMNAVDSAYDVLSNWISDKKYILDEAEFEEFKRYTFPRAEKWHKTYWGYFAILTIFYRYIMEHPELIREIYVSNIDRGGDRPPPPPPDVMNEILNVASKEAKLLTPVLAEYAAKRLLSTALLTSRPKVESVMVSATAKVPWYRRPRGKLDPSSLLKPSILDWKVEVSQQVPLYRRKSLSVFNVPDKITIIIDESGSTGTPSTVLSPIVGTDTTVYDVERVTVMSLLLNVLRHADPETTLVRFSSHVEVSTKPASEIYTFLKNIDDATVMWGATNIEDAIREAVVEHVDKPANYFLLLTDMAITAQQAADIRRLILEHLTRSPVLVLAVNADIPAQLEALNTYRNIAIVSVQTVYDYPKLENAIKKLATLLK